jgi:hypothetical protein
VNERVERVAPTIRSLFARGRGHVERLVRPFVVVAMHERVEAHLLIRAHDVFGKPFPNVDAAAMPKGRSVRRFLDAHDCAVDQFKKKAELTVDSSSDINAKRFQERLTA